MIFMENFRNHNEIYTFSPLLARSQKVFQANHKINISERQSVRFLLKEIASLSIKLI